ncbi:hypothetical protein, partial [Pseudomonas syringae]|uniref:hypothetical protein n=1 Tax=Pseudomonas syringae TaxID=317 RepID=UPI0034D6449A
QDTTSARIFETVPDTQAPAPATNFAGKQHTSKHNKKQQQQQKTTVNNSATATGKHQTATTAPAIQQTATGITATAENQTRHGNN